MRNIFVYRVMVDGGYFVRECKVEMDRLGWTISNWHLNSYPYRAEGILVNYVSNQYSLGIF